jgi:peptide/nickel transport system substrate-binding protein
MALALAFTQVGCQAPPPTSRITVASAGRISSLDPAQASTLSAIQLISALGDPAVSP